MRYEELDVELLSLEDWEELGDSDDLFETNDFAPVPSLAESYIVMLDSDDSEAQQSALRVMQEYGPRVVTSGILDRVARLTLAPEPDVRVTAANAAAEWGEAAGQHNHLIASLKTLSLDKQFSECRYAAMRTLYRLIIWRREDTELKEFLRKVAMDPTETDLRVRAWARQAVAETRSYPVLPVLALRGSALMSDFFSRQSARLHTGLKNTQEAIDYVTILPTTGFFHKEQVPLAEPQAGGINGFTWSINNSLLDASQEAGMAEQALLYLNTTDATVGDVSAGDVALVSLSLGEDGICTVYTMFHDVSVEPEEGAGAGSEMILLATLSVPETAQSVLSVIAPVDPQEISAFEVDSLLHARQGDLDRSSMSATLWDEWIRLTSPPVYKAIENKTPSHS